MVGLTSHPLVLISFSPVVLTDSPIVAATRTALARTDTSTDCWDCKCCCCCCCWWRWWYRPTGSSEPWLKLVLHDRIIFVPDVSAPEEEPVEMLPQDTRCRFEAMGTSTVAVCRDGPTSEGRRDLQLPGSSAAVWCFLFPPAWKLRQSRSAV